MMEALARFILARRYYILGAVGIITLVLGFFSLRIDLNKRPDELMFKDDPAYPRLQAFFEEFGYDEVVAAAYSAHRDWLLRAHAVWAVGRLGGPWARNVLQRRLAEEPRADVRTELVAALGAD